MENEQLSSTLTINATPDALFGVLADPSTHQAIDGTGWVREAHDRDRLSATGQTFRMAMYHEGHPNKDYEIVNEVVVLDEPRWSQATAEARQNFQFPILGVDHLEHSLEHLASLVAEPQPGATVTESEPTLSS